MKNILGLCIFCAMLMGCQKLLYTYDVKQTVSNDQTLSTKPYPVYVQMAYRGVKKSNKNGSKAFKFDVLVENRGEQKVTLAPTDYYILDEEQKRINSLIRKEHKNLTLAPNTSTLFPVFYELPTGYDMDDSQLLQMVWGYNVEEQKYNLQTKLDRRMIREKDIFGYPYSLQFYEGAKHLRRMGPGPFWRYQNIIERRGIRRRGRGRRR
ncbi:hypothetical protein [Candidatus Uabimicrobium amorphum]|uniref:Uncharacterized protein n=1 Tax=Uabimicrobium amorphum TaxID=2596890 RepID=A0A5S9F4J2_UABAM|nr:hypothetical protein [Candidatus Uabimicrobium amorphum]BBM84282.1 hypothetical protein UABAM_02639 [Candidatus Uabimicrobium amorphum]